MKAYPHHYSVEATAAVLGGVELTAEGLPPITSAPPVEFDGPGDQWSPESLLVASVVDCFVLTFRAIARASKLDWTQLNCNAMGKLDHVDRVTRFVRMGIAAELTLPPGGNAETGRRLLEKAEKACLVTNSLNFATELEAKVHVQA